MHEIAILIAKGCRSLPPEVPKTTYDELGRGYASVRRADPRIAARIDAALGYARTVVNVGAGAGSYEPPSREVTAVEPSAVMIAQRPAGAAPAVQASAEELPFDDRSFDAAMRSSRPTTGAIWRRGCASCDGWRGAGS